MGKDNIILGEIEGAGLPDNGVIYKSLSGDFAEALLRLRAEEAIEAGDIVGVFGGRVTRKTEGAENLQMISTAPIILGNAPPQEEEHLWERVAFLGQAPVKVRGKVRTGDYIVPSGLNDGTGLAIAPSQMRLADFGKIVSRAWESSDEEGVKLVKAVVGLAPPGSRPGSSPGGERRATEDTQCGSGVAEVESGEVDAPFAGA